MPLLTILLLVTAIRGITLPGAAEGLNFLFKPDFSRIFDFNVWVLAYSQIFFSLSICFAIMIAYSSYLPRETDIVNNGFLVSLLNCSFSLLAGLAVFGVLGFMAKSQGVALQDVATESVGLAFTAFPAAINEMPFAPQLFGAAFFLSLVFAGLSSAISINEAVISGIVDKFGVDRKKTVNIYTLVALLVSLLFVTGNGANTLGIFDGFAFNFGIAIGGLLEVVLIGWFFNLNIIKDYINPMSDFSVGSWWVFMLRIITPLVLGIMLVMKFIDSFNMQMAIFMILALVLGIILNNVKWKNEELMKADNFAGK